MVDTTEFAIIVVCILGCILLVVLTIFVLRLMKTLKKVDYLIDDVSNKSAKLDGVFNIVDRSADALTLMTDRAVAFISNTVLGFFNKKERKEEDENE